MPSNHLIFCHQPPLPPALNLSLYQGLFPMSWLFISGGQSTGASASASVLPTISFRNDWFDLHAVQGTLKSLLQHRCLKASVLQHTTSLMVQLSHLYMTIGKNTALTRWTFVGKVMSLLFNMLSRFVIAILSRPKRLLISWLQSLSTEILELKKIKSVTVSTFSPSIRHEVMGPDAMIFVLLKTRDFTKMKHNYPLKHNQK